MTKNLSKAQLIRRLSESAGGTPVTVRRAGDGVIVCLDLGTNKWAPALHEEELDVAPEVAVDFDPAGRRVVLTPAARELTWERDNRGRIKAVVAGPRGLPRVRRGATSALRGQDSWAHPKQLAQNPIGALFAFVDDALEDTGWSRQSNTGLAEKKNAVGVIVALVMFAVVGVIVWQLLT